MQPGARPRTFLQIPGSNAMGRELEEKSAGRLKFKVYWAGSLGMARDQFMMVKNGVVDMADFAGPWMPGKFTLSEIANLPMAAKSAHNVIKAMNVLNDKGYFAKQWGEVEVLTFSATPPYDIIFRKVQPMTMEGLAGLKIRTPGGYVSDYLKALRMIPVNISPGDAYLSWQTGVVDAWINPPGTLIKYKFHELHTKALLDANLQVFGNAAVIMNKKKYAELGTNLQKLVRDTVVKYTYVHAQIGHDIGDEALKTAQEVGIPNYTMPESEIAKIKTAGRLIWDKYVADMKAKNLPGKEVAAEFTRILRDLGENPPY